MSALPDVVRHMTEWGFTKIDPQPDFDWLVMAGVLKTATQGEALCEIWIDRSLELRLRVRLTPVPAHLPRLVPHLGPSGFLCYV